MLTEREKDCLNHFYTMFEHQWKLNDIYRTQYDEDLEYYIGYRDEKKYPLFYNMFFPQLLPRILTMLGRMLEQIYQGGTNELVSARPRKRSDVERAPRIRGLLNYQLENLNAIDKAGSSYLFNLQWMTNALAWGKGVAKLYWRKEERIAPLRKYFPFPVLDKSGRIQGFDIRSTIVEAPQIVYDAPYAEVLHPKMAVPHPNYKNIQLMPGFFIVYRRTLDQVVKNVEKGIYRSDSLEQLKDSFANTSKEPSIGNKSYEAISKSIELEGLDFATFKSDYSSPGIDIIEGYAKYIFPEDEVPYELGSGVKIKGKESEAICHFDEMGKVLFKIQKNTYGFRPFFDISGIMHPETFYDLGIIRLGKDIQDQYNTLANTRHQGSIMQLMQMLKVREDADIPPEALIWKPFGLIPVENMEDVEIFPTADLNQSGVFREQEEFFKSTIEDMTGMYRYNMGSTPTRQEHVGTIYSLQAMGESRTKLLLMTMDYQGFQPFLKHMMRLNTWHLPDDFEVRINTQQGDMFTPLFPGDLHPDYDFTVRYTSMEPALGKHFRAQQLIQYAQMWAQSPYLQQHQFMKAILEMLDFSDTDKYLKSPEQVAQEQQMMMQTQIQMHLGNMELQDAMAARDDERTLQREIVKGLLK